MKKIVIIGATSAIAQEVSKIYAQEKASLVLIGRNIQALTVIEQDLKARGAHGVKSLVHDLNDMPAHKNLIQQAFDTLGGIDIVLLAHGILGDQKKAEGDIAEMLNIINSNFVSHASLLTSISEKLTAQGSGTIAVISSVAGDRGKQSNYVYGSAKAGKTAFVDGLRNRLFPSGVHVVNIKLGFVDTPMTKDFKKGALWAKAPAIAQGITKAIDKKKDTVYLPFFWQFIMLIITSIPENIFKRLKL
jgi:short-subunit dehydrogenase